MDLSSAQTESASDQDVVARVEFGISEITDVEEFDRGQSFLLADRDRNWWEIAYLAN